MSELSAVTDGGFETLAELAEAGTIKTSDAEVDFTVSPTKLHLDGATFEMGVCTGDDRLSRGLREYKFKTGPYSVRVLRNDQAEDGPLYQIDVDLTWEEA